MKKYKLLFVMLMFVASATAQINSIEEDTVKLSATKEQKIKVFPNPATNVVNILGLKNSMKANISIADLSGNIVLNRQWAIRKNAISIPIPNLNAGIYFIRIEDQNQRVKKKFLKQ